MRPAVNIRIGESGGRDPMKAVDVDFQFLVATKPDGPFQKSDQCRFAKIVQSEQFIELEKAENPTASSLISSRLGAVLAGEASCNHLLCWFQVRGSADSTDMACK
jgi:hypothetical protein